MYLVKVSDRLNLRYENGLKCLDMVGLMMGDWDPAPAGKLDNHYTVTGLEQIDSIMSSWARARPNQLWLGYKTPSGGAHAFLVSHVVGLNEGINLGTTLRCDKLYLKYCLRRGSFAVRVSPKLNREGDYIAKFWKTWGNGKPDPRQEEIMRGHDAFLAEEHRYYEL